MPEGRVLLGENSAAAAEHPTLEALGRTATLCNDAALRARGGTWMVEGDPMEGALLSLATNLGADRPSSAAPGREALRYPSTRATATWRLSIALKAAKRSSASRARPSES